MKIFRIAMLYLLLVGLCSCVPTTPEETTVIVSTDHSETTQRTNIITTAEISDVSSQIGEIKNDEKDPYTDVVKSIINAHNDRPEQLKNVYFFLYDLDGDGTRELLLGVERWERIFLIDVYIIQNSIAVEQKELFIDPVESPQPLLYKNGTIKDGGEDAYGELSICYYRCKDGELRAQVVLIDERGSYFRSNGTYENFKKFPITKEEYDRVQKEFEGDGQVVELDWKPLAEYGR